ncbi:MAG: serine hydrolase domain-containing protein [Eubacteriales bacterium]
MNFSNLSAFLDHLVNEIGIPSCDLTLWQDHREIYRYSVGWQCREKQERIRRDSTYFLYSCSKPVTCTAALQLFEKGKFLMTDPLASYLPAFGQMQVKTDNGIVAAKRQIRVIDLFTMSAGLDYNLNTPAVLEVKERTLGRCPTIQIVDALAKSPLSFEPGTGWQYSLCHDVLAALVEAVSGMRFADYVKKNIFDPLEMTHSCYHLTDEIAAKMPEQTRYDFASKKASPIGRKNDFVPGPDYDSGGAGLISTVDDMIRFADALANHGLGKSGERILSPRTVDLMRTNALDSARLADFNWTQMAGYGYGLGVRTMIDPIGGGALSPVGEFGWGGAAGSYLMIDPDNRLCAFYAQHMLVNLEDYVHPRLRNLIYAGLDS